MSLPAAVAGNEILRQATHGVHGRLLEPCQGDWCVGVGPDQLDIADCSREFSGTGATGRWLVPPQPSSSKRCYPPECGRDGRDVRRVGIALARDGAAE
jgi:hypothetical protein